MESVHPTKRQGYYIKKGRRTFETEHGGWGRTGGGTDDKQESSVSSPRGIRGLHSEGRPGSSENVPGDDPVTGVTEEQYTQKQTSKSLNSTTL